MKHHRVKWLRKNLNTYPNEFNYLMTHYPVLILIHLINIIRNQRLPVTWMVVKKKTHCTWVDLSVEQSGV